MTRKTVNRRRFVQLAGASGALALAGCSGNGGNGNGGNGNGGNGNGGNGNGGNGNGGNDERETIRFVTAPEATSTYPSTQAIAAVVNQNSDQVRVDAQPGPGSAGSIGAVARDEADVGYAENWAVNKVMTDQEPFAELDFTIQNGFTSYAMAVPYATNNQDWETLDDLRNAEGTPTGFLTPPGSGSLEAHKRALLEAGIEEGEHYEVANIGYGDIASAMSEGRISFTVILLLNNTLPSYMQQVTSQNEMKMIDWPEEDAQEAASVQGLKVRRGDFSQHKAHFTNELSDPIYALYSDYNYFMAEGRASEDAVYNMVRTLYDNSEQLSETHYYFDQVPEDDEWWAQNPFPDVPFHPGIARFLEEIGQWNDDWTVGNA